MEITKTLYVHKPQDWRAWLRKNHQTAREIWLVYYKKHSGKPRISYNDAVDEAMCFGWIDSTLKAIDKDCFCQRFTPRRKGSPCSEMNKARAHRMIQEGKMKPAGLAALEGVLAHNAKITKKGIRHPQPLAIPPGILKELRKNKDAWKNYQKFPEPYRRIRIGWIAATTRPDAFKTRLTYFIKMTAQNKRFGMIQK